MAEMSMPFLDHAQQTGVQNGGRAAPVRDECYSLRQALNSPRGSSLPIFMKASPASGVAARFSTMSSAPKNLI